MNRNCDNCTKCCEGWLQGNIRGHKMGPTDHPYKPTPCIFINIGIGCKEYKSRPKNPCKTFQCEWIKNKELPEEFKPNLSNALPISAKTRRTGISYFVLLEAGEKMDPDALSWYITWAMSKQINFAWRVNGKLRWMGHPNFQQEMNEEFLNHKH